MYADSFLSALDDVSPEAQRHVRIKQHSYRREVALIGALLCLPALFAAAWFGHERMAIHDSVDISLFQAQQLTISFFTVMGQVLLLKHHALFEGVVSWNRKLKRFISFDENHHRRLYKVMMGQSRYVKRYEPLRLWLRYLALGTLAAAALGLVLGLAVRTGISGLGTVVATVMGFSALWALYGYAMLRLEQRRLAETYGIRR